jgi:branched-chain amino acid transport system permease protein
MRAMASNMRGAQLCGYSVDGIYAQAWVLGGGLAGLAGVFAAPRLGVSPELAAATIVPAFVAAIIGGFDSLGGAILGGLMLGLLETYTAAYLSDTFKNPLTFVLLLAVLLFKPEGLFAPKSLRGV